MIWRKIFRRGDRRPSQPRDLEGRFISRRVEAVRKAREIAVELGRDDLLARLSR
ncbi:hypothetical protein AB1K62_14460 [Parasphingorhabdus sp. JC815]|uniref:hypothetical protein n=1 Tax=Parasphingorhabdus sp. JC815 TaxID=3232140 RepID=UPI00345A2813